MFGIGRLKGNNLRIGSIDVTPSQLYTGVSHPVAGLIGRVIRYFCTDFLFCKSNPDW